MLVLLGKIGNGATVINCVLIRNSNEIDRFFFGFRSIHADDL